MDGASISGRIFGGRQPIVGATIQLWAANGSIYGGAATQLLTNSVLSDSSGAFSISNYYSCPAGALVYLTATGGDAGSGSNSAILLMDALGSCSTLAANKPYLVINEVSTVAAVYALSGFMTSPLNVGASATNSVGLANAFSAVNNLVNLSTGVANAATPGGNGTVPAAKINTLANILSACVNSTGPSSTACATLFSNAPDSNAVQPSTTAQAAVNIAHSPAAHIAALFGIAPAAVPFNPSLAAAPNDWTLSIIYAPSGLGNIDALAFDSAGNVWAAGFSSTITGAIGAFTPLGVPLSGSPFTAGGLRSPQGLAFDGTGNLWVYNCGSCHGLGGTISELSAAGAPVSGSPFAISGYPLDNNSIAVDAAGSIWVGDAEHQQIFTLNGSGTVTNTISLPSVTGASLAIDGANHLWTIDSGLREYTLAGANVGGPYSLASNDSLITMAIDSAGSVWIGGYYTPNTGLLYKFLNTGAAAPGSPFTGGGLGSVWTLAVDGSGNVWTSDYKTTNLSEFSSTGSPLSPPTAFTNDSAPVTTGSGGVALAIDGSGNVWQSNFTGQTLIEMVGSATPVVTPIVGVTNNTVGMRP